MGGGEWEWEVREKSQEYSRVVGICGVYEGREREYGECGREGLVVYGVGSGTDFSNGFFHFWPIENSLKVARPLGHQLFSIAISH